MSAADADLIPGLQAQDEATVSLLLDRYWERAYRVAYQLTGETGAAEDVAQDTFVAVLRGVGKLKEGDPFRAWFFRILENTAKKHHRSRTRRASHEGRASQRSGSPAAPGQPLEQAEEAALVRRHLGELSPKLRHTLALRYLEGMSLEEVARALEIPRKTVSSRIKRGLESLRESLQPAFALSVAAVAGCMSDAMAMPAPSAPSAGAILVQPPAPAPTGALIAAARPGRLAPGLALGLTAALLALVSWVLLSPGLEPTPPTDQVAVDQDPPRQPEGSDTARADGPPSEGSESPGDEAETVKPGPTPAEERGDDAESTQRPRFAEDYEQPPSPGKIRLSGRVVHADTGEPLAGVEVYPFEARGGAAFSSSRNSAISDAAGRFVLTLKDSVTGVGLMTRRPGFRPLLRAVSLETARRPLELQVKPGESARLVGRVLRPDGTPATEVGPEVSLRFEAREAGRLDGAAAPAELFEGRLFTELRVDAAGRFALEGIPAGAVHVLVREASLGYVDASAKGLAAADPEELLIQLASCGKLIVEVRDRSGSPQADAAVALQLDPSTPSKRTRTLADGLATFNVTPGDYHLRIVFPVGPPSSERTLRALRLLDTAPDHVGRVTVEAGREARVLVQRSDEKRGALTVEVHDAAGDPQAGVKVWLNRANRSWYEALEVVSDAEGRAVFSDLPFGRYGLQTAEQRSQKDPEATVVVDGAEQTVRLEAVPLTAVEGVVVDGSGHPVSGARVSLTPGVYGVSNWSGKTDAEGRFSIATYPKGGVVGVRVDADDFLSFDTIRPVDGQPWRLKLAPGRTLLVNGRVEAPDGTLVRLSTRGSGGEGKVVAGRFAVTTSSFDPSVAGELWVRVGETVPFSVLFAAGQTEVDVGARTLRAGRTVRGRVVVPASWRGRFSGRASGGPPHGFFTCEVDGDGRFVLAGLPDDPFELRVSLSCDGEQRSALVRVDPVGAPDLGEIETR